MQKRKIVAVSILFIVTFVFSIGNIFFRTDINTSYALSKYGSNSEEVKQIQTKLKRWGYYNGAIDGIVGPKTLAAMGIFTSNETNNKTNTNSDLNLLSHLVYAEARGESYTRTSCCCCSCIK